MFPILKDTRKRLKEQDLMSSISPIKRSRVDFDAGPSSQRTRAVSITTTTSEVDGSKADIASAIRESSGVDTQMESSKTIPVRSYADYDSEDNEGEYEDTHSDESDESDDDAASKPPEDNGASDESGSSDEGSDDEDFEWQPAQGTKFERHKYGVDDERVEDNADLKTDERQHNDDNELHQYGNENNDLQNDEEKQLKPTPIETQKQKRSISWEDRFQELKAFKAKFGHCRVTQRSKDNFRLFLFVKQTREYKKRNTGRSILTPARIIQLDDLGFEWSPQPSRAKKGKTFDERMEELGSFKEKFEVWSL